MYEGSEKGVWVTYCRVYSKLVLWWASGVKSLGGFEQDCMGKNLCQHLLSIKCILVRNRFMTGIFLHARQNMQKSNCAWFYFSSSIACFIFRVSYYGCLDFTAANAPKLLSDSFRSNNKQNKCLHFSTPEHSLHSLADIHLIFAKIRDAGMHFDLNFVKQNQSGGNYWSRSERQGSVAQILLAIHVDLGVPLFLVVLGKKWVTIILVYYIIPYIIIEWT